MELTTKAVGMARDGGREQWGYPIAEMIADDVFDNVGLRAQWWAMVPGRSIHEAGGAPHYVGIHTWR